MEAITWINYFLWGYGIFFALVALFGFSLQRNKERGYSEGTKISAEAITVLIPFRNEEENLPKLLESIQKLQRFPAVFVFINDHSDDGSLEVFNNWKDLPIVIIENPAGCEGKKTALREGAKHVRSEYTLTWDADVVVASDYFNAIEQLTEADMYVLPAIFTSQSFLQHLFTFDIVTANAVNAGLAGWRRPIFASGANLLYRTHTFEQLDTIAAHGHISSGDDTFLLRDFTRNKATVRLSTDPSLAVKTEAPTSFGVYLSQRLRWVSKTNALKDAINTYVAIKQLLFMMVFIALMVWLIADQFWFGLIYLVTCKMVTDFLVFSAYFKQINRTGLLLLLPIAEFWFPIYSVVLAALIPFYKPSWKGRQITSK